MSTQDLKKKYPYFDCKKQQVLLNINFKMIVKLKFIKI